MADINPSEVAPTDLLEVKQFGEKYPPFPPPALRGLIYAAEDRTNSRGERIPGNGLADAGAIVRVGRRVLISESRFFWWIAQGQRRSSKRKAAA